MHRAPFATGSSPDPDDLWGVRGVSVFREQSAIYRRSLDTPVYIHHVLSTSAGDDRAGPWLITPIRWHVGQYMQNEKFFWYTDSRPEQ